MAAPTLPLFFGNHTLVWINHFSFAPNVEFFSFGFSLAGEEQFETNLFLFLRQPSPGPKSPSFFFQERPTFENALDDRQD